MLKGKILSPSSTLGIVAPASPEKYSSLKPSLNLLKCYFNNIKLGAHVLDRTGYLAGDDVNRANDINKMFLDDSIDGIICLRGGYGSIRTLSYINPDIIKCHPKFFCGFSDITLLLNYFTSLGLITFHGPMINSNLIDSSTLSSLIDISSCNTPNYTYDLTQFNDISYLNTNSFTGKLIGGNLSIICSSLKTPYEITAANSILLLEEVNEEPYVLDRMLTQLLYSDYFKSCRGIIVGHLDKQLIPNLSYKKKLQKVFIERLTPLNIPLIIGFPSGHDYPNLTLPIGSIVSFNPEAKRLIVKDNFLI